MCECMYIVYMGRRIIMAFFPDSDKYIVDFLCYNKIENTTHSLDVHNFNDVQCEMKH